MKTVLVDTGIWTAYVNTRDSLHQRATAFLSEPSSRFITIWPIVWETVTLLCRKADANVAVEAGMKFLAGELAEVVELTPSDYVQAWALMRKFADRRLSAADATACAIARRLRVDSALSFDRDFEIVLRGGCEVRGVMGR